MSNLKLQLKSIRDGFGEGLLEIGRQNTAVVALSADLTESVRMQDFADKYPDRFFQVGIAEQNMAATAVGMALSGLVPYIGSFACFQPMRNLDQIRTSICIMNANVKIISSHAGFSYPADGIQIEALEDVGIMRMLPGMQVWVPADAEQAKVMAIEAARIDGPVYIRLGRAETPILSKLVADLSPVQIGEAQQVRKGNDLTIIATGYMVYNAWQVAEMLVEKDIQAGIINMHTIKPIDEASIVLAASQGTIVTLEEHQVAGGLGSAVAEVLAKHDIRSQLKIIGVQDSFGDSAATSAELWKHFGLDPASVLRRIEQIR